MLVIRSNGGYLTYKITNSWRCEPRVFY